MTAFLLSLLPRRTLGLVLLAAFWLHGAWSGRWLARRARRPRRPAPLPPMGPGD